MEKVQKRQRTNIEPRIIRGDEEFFQAWGISRNVQTKLRSEGLPCYYDGKYFFYYPDEVDAWLKGKFKIQRPELPILT